MSNGIRRTIIPYSMQRHTFCNICVGNKCGMETRKTPMTYLLLNCKVLRELDLLYDKWLFFSVICILLSWLHSSSRKSLFTSSTHSNLGCLFIFFFFTFWLIFKNCPSHPCLVLLITHSSHLTAASSEILYNSPTYWLVVILTTP
jgi:hypothetical protein